MFENDRPRSRQSLPAPLNSEPLNPVRRVFDADDRLVVSTPCVRCGYDLRHQKRDGTCPECNLEVTQSIFGLAIRTADPDYYRAVLRGVRLMQWSAYLIVVSCLGSICLASATLIGVLSFAFILPATLCAGCFLGAVHSVARRSLIEDARDRRLKAGAIPAILLLLIPIALAMAAIIWVHYSTSFLRTWELVICGCIVPLLLSVCGLIRCVWIFATLLASYLHRWDGDDAFRAAERLTLFRNQIVAWFLFAPTITAVAVGCMSFSVAGDPSPIGIIGVMLALILLTWTLISWTFAIASFSDAASIIRGNP